MYTLYGQNFINMIKSFYPTAKIEGGNGEVVVRCLFCGDSENHKHAHLYIKVPRDESEISMYHCKKCNRSGIVDDIFLRRYGCEDSRVLVEIATHLNKLKKLPQYTYLRENDKAYITNRSTILHKNDQIKLEYINNRIGSNFTRADLSSLKIFLNLEDVIRQNNLELTRDFRVVNALSDNFIGFISYDNKSAVLRQVLSTGLHKSVDKRYINYNLIPTGNSARSLYVVPTNLHVDRPEPVSIHIAEGVFDVLSIFYNINSGNREQNVYMASLGKSYSQALEFILLETGIINYIVHFYPDNDISDRQFNNMIRPLKGLDTQIYAHRNMYPGEKDFGVKIELIREEVHRLL